MPLAHARVDVDTTHTNTLAQMDHFTYTYGYSFDYMSNDDLLILQTRPSAGPEALERSGAEKRERAIFLWRVRELCQGCAWCTVFQTTQCRNSLTRERTPTHTRTHAHTCTNSPRTVLEKLAASHGFAQSARLEPFAESVQQSLEGTRGLAAELAATVR